MAAARKYQQLRSEVGRKGLRILADVNVRDLQLGLVQLAPVNRDRWLQDIACRIVMVQAQGKDPRWSDPDFCESVSRAAAWLYDEREAIHARMEVAS